MPEYVEWCIEAADKWPQFSENLETETGIQLEYAKNGGLEIWLGDEEYNTRVNFIDKMRKHLGVEHTIVRCLKLKSYKKCFQKLNSEKR